MIRQGNPWTIKVELVEGCPLRCPFCGINGLGLARDEYHYADLAMVKAVIDDIASWSPRSRIEMAGRGEPTRHPQLEAILAHMRSRLSKTQLMMTTNGVDGLGRWAQFMARLQDLNVVIVDLYEPYGLQLRMQIEAWASQHQDWKLHDFEFDKFSPWHNHGNKGHHIVMMPDPAPA